MCVARKKSDLFDARHQMERASKIDRLETDRASKAAVAMATAQLFSLIHERASSCATIMISSSNNALKSIRHCPALRIPEIGSLAV